MKNLHHFWFSAPFVKDTQKSFMRQILISFRSNINLWTLFILQKSKNDILSRPSDPLKFKFELLIVSSRLKRDLERLMTRVVLQFPERESWRTCVKAESRYDTCFLPAASSEITNPSCVKLKLIFFASSARFPFASVTSVFSLFKVFKKWNPCFFSFWKFEKKSLLL